MNELMEEYIKDGLAGLRQLTRGQHLRPAQLAQTIVSVVAAPEAAADIVLQAEFSEPLEVTNGT